MSMPGCAAYLEAIGWAAAALLAVCCWLWAARPRTDAPGPPTLPLLGNLPLFWRLPVMVGQLRDMQQRYGDVFRFYVGPKLFVVVTQPEDVQRVMVTCRRRERDPYFMRPMRTFIGDGLITNKGGVWQAHRKVVEPTFHTEVLGRFTEAFNEAGLFVCDKLAATGGAEHNVYPTCFHSALRTLTSTIFGVGLDQLEPDQDRQAAFSAEFIKSMNVIQKVIFRPWLQIACIITSAVGGRWMRERKGQIHRLVNRGVEFRKRNGSDGACHKRKALHDILVSPHGGIVLSDQAVHDEACTFAMAGTETTASSLGFALSLLALYPEWQDAVQAELDDVFGSGDDYLRPATAGDVGQLRVMDSVLKETLRLFSVVPTLPHFAAEDTPLAGGRWVAPRGSCVLVALSLLHRQPELFPDPERFDPGRFLDGDAHQPCSYLPFGAGSRKCVGARFAQLEIKTVLAAVLRRFRVLPGSSRLELEQVSLSITGLPLTGLRVSCVPRIRNLPRSDVLG